ncbi:hypothetical protein SDC9_201081 [bioreactor metagenome]|uniref:Uncharacterized protein n=1 Tax=bioreactor metagenome TaxID=1076179 RepID=A0A645IQB0_9ZZZZ
MSPHEFPVKIHIDQALINLRDAVLQPGWYRKLFVLHRENQVCLNRLRDSQPVEAHQSTHTSRNNRAGAGHTNTARDIGLVAQREITPIQLDAIGLAVIVKNLDARLEQTDSAVIAIEQHVAG